MRASDLSNYLKNKTTIDSFLVSIEEEVRIYIKKLDKVGSAIILRFDEDEKVTIKISDLKKLLQDVQKTNFKPAHLSYISDCLTMAKNVEYETEKIEDLIWKFADPEINGYKTQAELLKILTAL